MNNPPAGDLYIYYIQGRLGDDERQLPQEGFIGNWQEDDTTFLFFDRPSLAPVEALAGANPELELLDHFQMTYSDWQGGPLAPFRVGRFMIHPAWMAPEGDAPFVLKLNPGVVFGAGTHPTTRDCLELLDWLFQQTPIDSALDLGAGTGLLTLAAARLGCRKTLAVDFNRLCAQTTWNNIRLNHLEEAALAVQGRAEILINCKADLVMANIHYDVMKDILRSPGFFNKRWFILSGLLRSEAAAVETCLAKSGLKIIEKITQDDIWTTYLGTTRIKQPKGWA